MRRTRLVAVLGALVGLVAAAALAPAQTEVSEQDLVRASRSLTVEIGSLSGDRPVETIPLELYVARVLAGEGEPDAAPAARQALAVAIRTYALVQLGTHRREGFDLCDTVHCQVLRASTPASRAAALATAGRVLAVAGAPAQLYYSASCGGRSEAAAAVWPGATFPYMQAVQDDDVHGEDEPWTLDLTIDDLQRALSGAGFGGRLRAIEIEARNDSGRVERIGVDGLRPAALAGTALRDILGTTRMRSTLFTLERRGDTVRFTGRGYGHGVGMCVIGAGRRARRGESVEQILAQYYPALSLVDMRATALRLPPAAGAPVPVTRPGGVLVRVPEGSATSAEELEAAASRAYTALAATLGASVTPVTVELHVSLDAFRLEARRPWWVSAAVAGTTIDLAPAVLLAEREGLEPTLRAAMAELLMASAYDGRPAWVRVGGARYFASASPPSAAGAEVSCPADAELTLALSAAAQREAESRALQCFARAYAQTRNWRAVGLP